MKVKRIKEIKNTDAFDSFSWSADDLKRYNLIYGWNGVGKTTISRILYSIEQRRIVPALDAAEFQVQTDGGVIRNADLPNHTLGLRVFNDDFVKDNLIFNESKANKILILGSDNTAAAAEIATLEEDRKTKQAEYVSLLAQLSKMPDVGEILTVAGREVAQQFSNTPLANGIYNSRSYNKRNIDALIASGEVSRENHESKIITKQEDVDRNREIVKSNKQKVVFTPTKVADFSGLFDEANVLLKKTLDVEVVEDLREDKELRDWTEAGYHLHKKRDAEACLFCKKVFDAGYLDRLGKFFTTELESVKVEIKKVIDLVSLPEYKGNIGSLESSIFFPDIGAEYLSQKSYAEEQARVIRAAIDSLVVSLQEKSSNLHNKDSVSAPVIYPASAVKLLNEACEKITSIVEKHNNQIEKIAEAAKTLELHIVATFLKSKDYFQKVNDIKVLTDGVKTAKASLDGIIGNIKTKQASILNASLAVEKINDTLKEFFGEAHIYLESDPSGVEVGYVLKRRGKNAKNLSQGEKSIIALMYFLIKLEEDGYVPATSLVVIDDPVDSQDEVFLFKTFGLIKRHVMHVGQIVVLTHNFPFFNLIRDWFGHSKLMGEAEFCLMKSYKDGTTNKSEVEKLPDLLRKYKTEYQYLFCQLYNFSCGKGGIDEPLIPNIGRKVLEYFAGFKWACDVSEDFANIVHSRFSKDTNPKARGMAEFVVKFLHEYSHGQDFTRPISASTFEAKAVVDNILLLIQLTDLEHYKKMTALCV